MLKQKLKCSWDFLSQKIIPLILETVFPKICIGCGEEGDFICENCFGKISRQKFQCCPICYKKNDIGITCVECMKNTYLDGLIACCEFKEKSLLQRSIHLFKYEFVESLGQNLSKLLIETALKNIIKGVVICPVPLHKNRYKWRGFNQAEILAENFCRNLGFLRANLLKRISYKKPQMELKREQRLKNVEDAFEFSCDYLDRRFSTPPNTLPENVLLIDDIATTTATLNACAKALKSAGVKTVYAIVLARVY